MKNLSSIPVWYTENETCKAGLFPVREHHSRGLFVHGNFVYGGRDGTSALIRWSFDSCGYKLKGPRVQGAGLADILSTNEGEIVDSQD